MTPPILYHYTNRISINGIFNDGKIKLGRFASYEAELTPGICLTSDTSCIGHGLPDGREITYEQAQRLIYFTRGGNSSNKYYCVDNTKYRIAIDTKKISTIDAATYYKKNPLLLSILEVRGYYPIGEPDYSSPLLGEGKAKTWFICFDEIQMDSFLTIGVAHSFDQYYETSVDEFQSYLDDLNY